MDTPVVSFSISWDDRMIILGELAQDGTWVVISPNRNDTPDYVGTADSYTSALELAMEYLRRA